MCNRERIRRWRPTRHECTWSGGRRRTAITANRSHVVLRGVFRGETTAVRNARARPPAGLGRCPHERRHSSRPVPHRTPGVGPHRFDLRVGHPRRGRQGQGPQGRRAPGHRLRCRRARLPHAGLHRRGRGGGLPQPQVPPLHPGRRPPRAEGRDRREDAARLRLRGRGLPGARHQRRQAGHLRGLRRDPRPGRRGHRPRPVLDHLPRVDPPRGRRAGGGRGRRDDRLPGLGRAVGGGAHRAHEGPALRLPLEPDRRGLHPRAGRGRRPLGRRARPVGADGRDLRAPGLRRRRVLLAAGGRAGAARQVRRRQRCRQDVRDDRLARGVDHRPPGRRQGRDQPAVARHVERVERRPGGGPGGRVG